MKNLTLTLLLACSATLALAQIDAPKPELSKQAIGKTGYSAQLPSGFTWDAPTKSPDSSDVYTGTKDIGNGYKFGVVAVKFSDPLFNNAEELQDMVIAYMDSLKTAWKVKSGSGYGRDQLLPGDASARGVIDYWHGPDSTEWSLKGWANKTGMCILYIVGPNTYPHMTVQNAYFDGFRFR